MQRTSIISIIVSTIVIGITLPFYFTIGGLSLMAFDAPDAGLRAAFVVSVVAGLCILLPVGSFVGSLLLIRRKKHWYGLLLSLLPVVCLGIFWLWLSQQSFT